MRKMRMSNLLSLYEELFQQGRIAPNWKNISFGMAKEISDDILIVFLSKNTDELLNEKFEDIEDFKKKVTEILYKNVKIDIDIYKKLTGHLELKFEEIFDNFPLDRIKILIENKCLKISDPVIEELVDRIEANRDEENKIKDFSFGLLLIDLFYNMADPNSNVDHVEIFIDFILKESFKEDIKLFLVEEYYSRISEDNKSQAVEILFKDEDSSINYAIKNRIIDTQDFVLSDLSILKDSGTIIDNRNYGIFTNLFFNDKIAPNWSNLLEYVNHPKNNSTLSKFMNRHIGLLIEDNLDEEQKNFIEEFILSNELLDNDVYVQLVDKIDVEIFESINIDLSWEKILFLSQKKLLSLNCIELIYQKRDRAEAGVGVELAEDIILSIIELYRESDTLETHEIWQYLNYKNILQNKLITKFLSSGIDAISKEMVFQQVVKSYQGSQMTEDFSLIYPLKKVDIIKLASLLENDLNCLQLLIYYYESLNKEDLINVFKYFKDEIYQQLAPDWDKRPKLEVNDIHENILEKLVVSGYLSPTSLDNKGGEYHIRKIN